VVRIDNIRSSSAFNPRRRPALAPAAVARFEQAANRVKLSAASTAALALRTRGALTGACGGRPPAALAGLLVLKPRRPLGGAARAGRS
jgi:hypothetical protein